MAYAGRMAALPIITGADNPILRRKTERVPQVTKKTLKLIKDMRASMKEANGVGLAAPQVAESLRVCLVTMNGKIVPLINPDITWMNAERAYDEEGCLSLPNTWLQIPRATEITLTYTDEKNQPQERRLKDFDARVVQHEVDHLEGVLIVDYITGAGLIKEIRPQSDGAR
jgi:peptide deformylase